ncbi:MAG: hypothetical protein K6G25_06075 [Bacteroidales bacterium]|nr:hypothetical protein [Bacteroidales bacterium]
MKKTLVFLLALAIGMASCSNNNSQTKEATKPTTSSESHETKSPTNDAINYDTYINPRFGFSILYPTFLIPEPEPENGDGRIFTKGKDEEMSVFASYNVLDDSIEELFKECKNSYIGNISYAVQKDNWFVVSGTNDEGTILYRKTILTDDVEYTVNLIYPKAKKQLYDEIVDKVTKSFNVD